MASSKQTVNMQRLADLANVSRSTVSRALADSPLVNAGTKARIKALAEEHNYVVDEVARSLRLRQSRTVCVVLMMDKDSRQRMSDPFFLEMLGCIADGLAEGGYDMLLSHKAIGNAADFRASRGYQRSDGVLFVGQGRMHDDLNDLAMDDRPIVVWGQDRSDADYCVVGSDNRDGGYRAASHLLDAGRQSLAFFGDRSLPEPAARHEGFLRAIRERSLSFDPSNDVRVPFAHEHAAQAIDEYLRRRPGIDGVVCCSDVIAVTALTLLGRHGINVPVDVAVTGYDNIDMASRANPPLTTIDQHVQEGGRLMVEKLFALIEGTPVDSEVLPAALVVRESSGVNAR